MQDLSEVSGILDQMYAIQDDTDAKEQEATIELDNYNVLYSGEGSQAANILNYVNISISIVILLAAIIYIQRQKK